MNKCEWTEDQDGNWQTRCGEIHIIITGTPEENNYRFCPYCGKRIEQARLPAQQEGGAK